MLTNQPDYPTKFQFELKRAQITRDIFNNLTPAEAEFLRTVNKRVSQLFGKKEELIELGAPKDFIEKLTPCY